jgi:molecular chaperone GrpE
MEKDLKENVENGENEFEDVQFENHSEEKKDNNKNVKDKKKNKKDDKLEEDLAESKVKIEELNDKYLRLFSDFDNFRKRKSTEILEIRKTAAEDLILSMLNIIDDFERAIANLPTGHEKDAFDEGIALIYNKLLNTLKQQGLEEIQALNAEFDTDFHEAITNIPAANESMKNKVYDVTQKGYTLNGKVIRFAKVVVAS